MRQFQGVQLPEFMLSRDTLVLQVDVNQDTNMKFTEWPMNVLTDAKPS